MALALPKRIKDSGLTRQETEAVAIAEKQATRYPHADAWSCCLQAPDSTVRYVYANGDVDGPHAATPPVSSVGGRPIDWRFLLR